MIEIRTATEADRLPLFKLSVAMHGESDFRHLKFDPDKALASLWGLIHGDGLMLVAEREGALVGMLAASRLDLSFSSELAVAEELFYVVPEQRGTRTGFRLMREFMRWAEAEGARQVRAGIATGIVSGGERLYEHFGMRCVGANFSMFLARK